jgi:hypothetical protein
MRAGHLSHEQDDREHHQPRCDDLSRTTDRVRKRVGHHSATCRDQHQQEGAEQLGEQAPPFLGGVLEALYRFFEGHETVRKVPGRGVEEFLTAWTRC